MGPPVASQTPGLLPHGDGAERGAVGLRLPGGPLRAAAPGCGSSAGRKNQKPALASPAHPFGSFAFLGWWVFWAGGCFGLDGFEKGSLWSDMYSLVIEGNELFLGGKPGHPDPSPFLEIFLAS